MANPHPNLAHVVNTLKQHSMDIARISEQMNIPAFDQALHPDWFMIDAHGKRFTKAEELQLLKTNNFKPSSLQVSDLHVTVHGDTAVVTGISQVKASFEGKDISGRYRFTQVYKADGVSLLDHAAKAVPANMAMITCITMALA